MSQLVINILDKALKSKGQPLKKTNEYMWWSPFISHHKPKLQVNIQTGKWHCWVSNMGGHNLFQLFKKVSATQEQFTELTPSRLEEIRGCIVRKYLSEKISELENGKYQLPVFHLSYNDQQYHEMLSVPSFQFFGRNSNVVMIYHNHHLLQKQQLRSYPFHQIREL